MPTSHAKRRTSGGRTKPARHSTRARGRRWSAAVTEHSDALDLEPAAFKGSARSIAASLKRAADRSARRKSSPFRSAMSMLTFYANRAGKNLSAARRQALARAKDELRKLYGKTRAG